MVGMARKNANSAAARRVSFWLRPPIMVAADRLTPGTTAAQVTDVLTGAHATSPFVRLTGDTLPEIKHVAWTNFCDIGWRVDAATGRIILVSALDNLVKGAAGQAVQNFNLLLGADERTGLL